MEIIQLLSGKSYLSVFIGVGFFVLLVQIIQDAFFCRGYYATSFYLSFTMFIGIWGNLSFPRMWRYIMVIGILYALLRIMLEGYIYKRFVRTFQKEPSLRVGWQK